MWLALALLVMLLLAAVSAGLYHYQTQPATSQFRWREGLIVASWFVAAVCIGQFWRQLKRGSLVWDGFSWDWMRSASDEIQVKSSSQTGSVSVRFDGQRCLLLKLEFSSATGRTQWLWLEQAFAPEHWHDLRRAVYSRAKEPVFNIQN